MHIAGLQASIIRFALRFRVIVVVLACLLVAYGIYVLDHASYDAFPEFAPPQVDIQTEAPGFSAEQVETLVTRPIEQAVNGIGNLQRIEFEFDSGPFRYQGLFRCNDRSLSRPPAGGRTARDTCQSTSGGRPGAGDDADDVVGCHDHGHRDHVRPAIADEAADDCQMDDPAEPSIRARRRWRGSLRWRGKVDTDPCPSGSADPLWPRNGGCARGGAQRDRRRRRGLYQHAEPAHHLADGYLGRSTPKISPAQSCRCPMAAALRSATSQT